jgi:hypothetical protein
VLQLRADLSAALFTQVARGVAHRVLVRLERLELLPRVLQLPGRGKLDY